MLLWHAAAGRPSRPPPELRGGGPDRRLLRAAERRQHHAQLAGCGASGRTLLAALVSFATGLLALLLLNAAQLAAQRHRGEPHGLRRPQRAWEACGGLLGSSVMVLTLLALPSTGFALIAVCRSAGQISSSLALDHTGCLGGEVRLLTRRRACGAALCVGRAAL